MPQSTSHLFFLNKTLHALTNMWLQIPRADIYHELVYSWRVLQHFFVFYVFLSKIAVRTWEDTGYRVVEER